MKLIPTITAIEAQQNIRNTIHIRLKSEQDQEKKADLSELLKHL